LPPQVSELVGELMEQGRTAVAVPAPIGPVGRLGSADSGAPPSRAFGGITPRTAAIAVMGMLAFGVAVGAVVGTGNFVNLAGAPMLLVAQGGGAPAAVLPGSVSSAAAVGNSGSGGGGGGGSSPAPETITITETASAPSTTTTTPTSTSAATGNSGNSGSAGGGASNLLGLPPIKHVFVIVLSDQGYLETFGSRDKYLSKTLPKQGKLLEFYYAVAGGPLANEVAMISGQGPTRQTLLDCPRFTNISPASKGAQGQVVGDGCVYPKRTDTLADQLTAAHYTWKAYVQDMASGPAGEPKTCRHPALGHSDSATAQSVRDAYVTWRNPFVYFDSLTNGSVCRDDDVDLSQLGKDLKSAGTTPNFSYIAPDPCDDGSDQPCAPNAKSGLGPADDFLRSAVPEIEKSPAYKANGLIAITFDQAPQTGPHADSSSCCGNPTYPNVPGPTTTTTTAATTPVTTLGTTTPATSASTSTTTTSSAPTTVIGTTSPATNPGAPTTTSTSPTSTGPVATTTTTTTSAAATTPSTTGSTTATGGGGQVGMLLISQYVKPGTVDVLDYYNHFAFLRSIEAIFELKYLGYANNIALAAFDAGIFDNYEQ
jgi:phosphatidylinositol-3-phosphatase